MSAALGIRNGVLLAAPFWAIVSLALVHACSAAGQSIVKTPADQYIAPTIARVQFLPLADARAACVRQGIAESVNPMACAWIEGGLCHIIMPYARDVGYEIAGRLAEHEPAHCWRWSHD